MPLAYRSCGWRFVRSDRFVNNIEHKQNKQTKKKHDARRYDHPPSLQSLPGSVGAGAGRLCTCPAMVRFTDYLFGRATNGMERQNRTMSADRSAAILFTREYTDRPQHTRRGEFIQAILFSFVCYLLLVRALMVYASHAMKMMNIFFVFYIYTICGFHQC